jgi:serine/threonine protein kinase
MKGMLIADRYRVLSKLGEGPRGEVYLALHVGLGRKEAIKVLRADVTDEPEFASRFRREARAANRVDHPAVVRVYDFGQLPDGRFFLAMEHAEGERLDVTITREGALGIERALDLLRQLADAVARAHERGVLHRDLKPENLVLVPLAGGATQLKILDFGLARAISPGLDEPASGAVKGGAFGTPEYMAPEQIAGDVREPRMDLYAIGCIAYEMLTGDPPFTGRPAEVLQQHATAVPQPPSKRRRSGPVPPALDQLVLRCLAKRPDDRYADAQTLAAALSAIGAGRPAAAPIPGHGAFDDDEGTATVTEPPSLDPSVDPSGMTLLPSGVTPSLVHAVRTLAEGLISSGARDLRISVGLLELEEQTEELARLDAVLRAAERAGAPLDRAIEHAAARGHAEDQLEGLARSLAQLCGEHRALAEERPALGELFETVDRLSARA